MMNGVGLNVNSSSQIMFQAKPGNRKAIHEFIDKTNDFAKEILNKDRPLEEKREIAFRESLKYLKMECPYFVPAVRILLSYYLHHLKHFPANPLQCRNYFVPLRTYVYRMKA